MLTTGGRLRTFATEWFYLPSRRRFGLRGTNCSEASSPRINGPQFTRSQTTGLSRLGEMLESYHKLQPKAQTIPEFEDALQLN